MDTAMATGNSLGNNEASAPDMNNIVPAPGATAADLLETSVALKDDSALSATDPSSVDIDAEPSTAPKKAKRYCRFPGCCRVIKSQGHCQRHGAKPKRCRVEGCDKQAQGTHDGMCKRHWKSIHFPDEKVEEKTPPPPEGESVYDSILPASIAYKPSQLSNSPHSATSTAQSLMDPGMRQKQQLYSQQPSVPPPGYVLMPLVAFLRDNASNEFGWHRKAERRARGVFPLSSLKTQLESWERQLALVETLLLSGGTPYACFRGLAHAWGRDYGFHTALVCAVFDRHGNVERKRRKDANITKKETKKAARKKAKNTGMAHTPVAVAGPTTTSAATPQQQDPALMPAAQDDAAVAILEEDELRRMGSPQHGTSTMTGPSKAQALSPLLEDAKPSAVVEAAAQSVDMMV